MSEGSTSPRGGRHRRQPGERQDDSAVRAPGRSRRGLATLVLSLLCVPAAVAAIVFWVQTPAVRAQPSLLSPASESALSAAKSAVHTILSYDYRAISADITHAKADTTGVFARQYASTASKLLSEAKQVKAIVQATVGAAGVVSTSPNEVVALLFVDQASVRQTPGQSQPTTRIDQSRVRVTMTRVAGRWLVSDLAAL